MAIDNHSILDLTRRMTDNLIDHTSISLDRSVKDLLDRLKIIRQESYNAEILRLVRELLEIKVKEVP
jgi:DNA helicase TIP49 (TBP-interacting protein)